MELMRLRAVTGKYCVQLSVPEVPKHGFAKYVTEVRGCCEITVLIELFRCEARPTSVHFAAVHGAAEGEHHVRVPVICSAVAVFSCGSAELGHRDHDNIAHSVTEVDHEGSKGRSELRKPLSELAFNGIGSCFIHMVVPTAHVSESDLQPHIGPDYLGNLLQALSELSPRIPPRIALTEGAQQLSRIEGGARRSSQQLVVPHRAFKFPRGGFVSNPEVRHIFDSDGIVRAPHAPRQRDRG